jgi:hypothetical protein
LQQLVVVNPEQPQAVRPAALAELQVIGVIDEAGEIGVLVVHPDRQDMRLALDAPGQIGPAFSHHRR